MSKSSNDDTGRDYIIEQFMWAYQHHFRISAEIEAKRVLESIGFFGEPEIILVGFQVAGEHAYDICIEPEQGPYTPSELAGVVTRGEILYQEHPDHDIWYSDPHHHVDQHRTLRDHTRGSALEEVLTAKPAGYGRSFFSSYSALVGDYEVHVILSVNSAALARVPQLNTTRRNRIPITSSLVHACINGILSHARRTLYAPDAGHGIVVLGAGAPEIVRGATETLIRSTMYCAGHWFSNADDLLLNSISALPYEGRSGTGRLIFARQKHPAIEVYMQLQAPVDMRETRAVRKLLEASGPEGDLLSNGEEVYGLGIVGPTYDVTTETVFVVSVTNRGTWELLHDGEPLLAVRDGVAQLPASTLDTSYFDDLISRVLPGADVTALLPLAQAAREHRHGAMLVISSDAAGEAKRLAPQAWAIDPVPLSPALLTQLTDMDGAVLVDKLGQCHAIGVILDGQARGKGEPSRGSRFNNAIRYLDSDPPESIVVVYSADGSIDILPRLHPRVDRRRVELLVKDYVQACSASPPRLEDQRNAWDTIKSLKFYLSANQCRQLNEARQHLNEWCRVNDYLQIIEPDLMSDPQMNDSYWLPEPEEGGKDA